MNKRIVTLASVLAVFTTAFGQVRVGTVPNQGDVIVGDIWATTPTLEFNVFGRMHITHNHRMNSPNFINGLTGVNFDIKTPTGTTGYNDGTTPQNPIMRPQWSNYYYLGDDNYYFKEVHGHDLYHHNGGKTLLISDRRLKENIQPLMSVNDKILNIKTYTYDYIYNANPDLPDDVNEFARQRSKNHTGIMAQDILTDFPDLVRYREDKDVYAVDYTGFIPYLIKAMQEQNEQIAGLQATIMALTRGDTDIGSFSTTLFGTKSKQTGSALQATDPISIKQEIKVSYTLAEGATNALLIVYDLNGRQLFKIDHISGTHTTLPKSKLTAGMYYYTLIADGKEVDTHKLIVLD